MKPWTTHWHSPRPGNRRLRSEILWAIHTQRNCFGLIRQSKRIVSLLLAPVRHPWLSKARPSSIQKFHATSYTRDTSRDNLCRLSLNNKIEEAKIETIAIRTIKRRRPPGVWIVLGRVALGLSGQLAKEEESINRESGYCRKYESRNESSCKRWPKDLNPEDPLDLTYSGNATNDNQWELDNIDGNANDEEEETLNEITQPSSSSQMPR
jgi:hypothetical protein